MAKALRCLERGRKLSSVLVQAHARVCSLVLESDDQTRFRSVCWAHRAIQRCAAVAKNMPGSRAHPTDDHRWGGKVAK